MHLQLCKVHDLSLIKIENKNREILQALRLDLLTEVSSTVAASALHRMYPGELGMDQESSFSHPPATHSD